MTYGWYDDERITNLINLNALGELIEFVNIGSEFKDITYIHDHIKEFESTISSELKNSEIIIRFEDSSQNEFLQMADNLVSITNHAFSKMKKHFANKEEWLDSSEWDMKLVEKLFSIINKNTNIKFTVPLADWAATLCVCEMFSNTYPKENRKNLFFNPMYQRCLRYLNQNIIDCQRLLEKIEIKS